MRLIHGGDLENVPVVRSGRTGTMEIVLRQDGLLRGVFGNSATMAGVAYLEGEVQRDLQVINDFTKDLAPGLGMLVDIRSLAGGIHGAGVLATHPPDGVHHMAVLVDTASLKLLADAYRGRAREVVLVEAFDSAVEALSWLLDQRRKSVSAV